MGLEEISRTIADQVYHGLGSRCIPLGELRNPKISQFHIDVDGKHLNSTTAPGIVSSFLLKIDRPTAFMALPQVKTEIYSEYFSQGNFGFRCTKGFVIGTGVTIVRFDCKIATEADLAR